MASNLMSDKGYRLSFTFHEPESHEPESFILLSYESSEEAVKAAKYFFRFFVEDAWQRSASDRNLQSTYNELLKIAEGFDLIPNETNFNFYDYFEKYYKFLGFKEEMDDIWVGMVGDYHWPALKLVGNGDLKKADNPNDEE